MKKFGHSQLKNFMIDPNYTNINAGSFGITPKSVHQARIKYIEQSESQPDAWIRDILEEKVKNVQKIVQKRIRAKQQDDIVFVSNIAEGLNCILNSEKIWNWENNDIILNSNLSYGMAKNSISRFLQKNQNLIINNEQVIFTENNIQTPELIIKQYEDKLNQLQKQNKKIKVVILDHFSATPSIYFPIKQIIQLFQKNGIKVIVDAAHALGQIDINIQDLNPDFYIGNFHKWYFSPTGSYLYFKSELYKETLKHVITSLYEGQGVQREFYWTGSRDYSNFLAIKEANEFVDQLDLKEIIKYNSNLAQQVNEIIPKIWNTNPLIKNTKYIKGNMVNIEVPCNDLDLALKINKLMTQNDGIFMVILQFDGKVYARFSCQIINQIEDYKKAAQLFKKYLQQFKPNL